MTSYRKKRGILNNNKKEEKKKSNKMQKNCENPIASEKLANKIENIKFNQKVCYTLVYTTFFLN